MQGKANIRSLFEDWVEPDFAEYYLACLLGMMTFKPGMDEWIRVKSVFDTNNEVSRALFKLLECAVEVGLLEKNDDGQYRWNKEFEGNLRWNKEWWGRKG